MLNIGVLFRNNEELVYPFFYFLRKSSPDLELRVTVVNNGSTDNTFSKLIRYKAQQDIILSLEENQGIAKGRNILLNSLYDDYGYYPRLLILDSDVFIYLRHSIKNMVKEMEDNKLDFTIGNTLSHYDNSIGDPGFCFVLFENGFFGKVGTFDERFKMFYDDSDLFYRAGNLKCRHKVCDKSWAIHFWGQTITEGSESYRRDKCLKEDKEKLIAKRAEK